MSYCCPRCLLTGDFIAHFSIVDCIKANARTNKGRALRLLGDHLSGLNAWDPHSPEYQAFSEMVMVVHHLASLVES